MGSEDGKEMLKAINEVKEALGTMEKLYRRAKDSRGEAKKEEQQLSMEKNLLKGINEVKDVLANMEKLYQKEKDNRERAKEARSEKEAEKKEDTSDKRVRVKTKTGLPTAEARTRSKNEAEMDGYQDTTANDKREFDEEEDMMDEM